jgi:hypothetical protein
MKAFLIPLFTVFSAFGIAANSLVVEKLDGPVTATEIHAFKNFMREVPPPTNNIHNAMVYGGSGMAVEALGRMVEVTGDQELLDRMIAFADAMLAARNDPQTGAVIWTEARDLVWPNQEPKGDRPLYSAAETGDVVGHIAYAAKLVLHNEKLWAVKVADDDPHHFGATYRERAIRYVRELDQTMDTFILKWFVHPDTLRYHWPNSPLYEAASKPGTANKPVPWNQQGMLNNGFQRLAECHALLGDDAGRVKHYEAIVKASVDWFFSMAERVTINGHLCYKWAYVAETPIKHVEDSAHGGYDITFLYRAYRSGRYGITAAMMEPLANTVLYVMRQPGEKFTGRVDGTTNGRPPGRLTWLDLCEFAPELFPILHESNLGRIKSSPELTANILWHKHRRATTHP